MTKELSKKKDDAPVATPVSGQFGLGGRDKIPAEVNAVGKFMQRRVLAAQRDPTEGGCARLVIRHVVNGQVRDRVDQAKIDEPAKVTEEAVGSLALEIYNCAYNDADNRGKGTEQKYVLQWYCENSPNEEPYCFPFPIKPGRGAGRDADGNYVDSYPATEQGHTAQLMREVAELHDTVIALIPAIATPIMAAKDIMEELRTENLAMRQEIRAGAKAIDDARHAEWERKEESLSREANREMWREATQGIKLLAPAIAKRVGLIDKTQPIPADSAHIVALVQSLAKRDALGKILASDLLNEEEKFHICSEVQAHLESVDLKDDKAAATLSVAKPSNGANGECNGAQTATAPAEPLSPEQQAAARAHEIEVAEAQAEAWRTKAAALKAQTPAVVGTGEPAAAAEGGAKA